MRQIEELDFTTPRARTARVGMTAAIPPTTLPSEDAVVVTGVDVALQAAAPGLCNKLGAVLWHGPWPRTLSGGTRNGCPLNSGRGLFPLPGCDGGSSCRRLEGYSAARQRCSTTRRRWSTMPCKAGLNWLPDAPQGQTGDLGKRDVGGCTGVCSSCGSETLSIPERLLSPSGSSPRGVAL